MEKVKFKKQCPRTCFVKSSLRAMMLRTDSLTYCIVIFIFFLGTLGLLKSNYIAQKGFLHGFVIVLHYLSIFLLTFPFGAIIGGTMIEHVRQSYDRKYLVCYVNGDGYGWNSTSDSNYFLKFLIEWKQFDSIRETKNSFLLCTERGTPYVICKRHLPAETTSAIRAILAEAPVEKKALFPNRSKVVMKHGSN